MTTNNQDVVLRLWYQELWDNWNIAVADELLTDDYRLHAPGVSVPLDRETTKHVVAMYGNSFPDLKHTVDEVIADDDTLAVRWTVRGTHRGEFQGIPASGKSIKLSGITVHHLVGARVRETWLVYDNIELLQQIGAVPAAANA
jgi:steroid delta-isomerase-like uncharacterized protein